MPSKTNPGKVSDKKKLQLDTVLIQLTSQRPSDIWRGIEQVRQWLKIDKEDREVYGILLDAVQKNPDLRQQVRDIFSEMMQQKSEVAEQALLRLPTFIPDILTEADDAYYAAEYSKAIQLYQQVLRLDPENARAKDHLGKAVIKRDAGESTTGLPRTAQQYYLRARSYLAAEDIVTALNLLSSAIEAAQAKGMRYPEAEETLINVQKILLADEHINKAKIAIESGQRREALANYKKALRLNPSRSDIRRLITIQSIVLNAWWEISVFIIIGIITYYGYSKLQVDTPAIGTTTPSLATARQSLSITPITNVTNTSTSIAPSPIMANTDIPISTETWTPSATFTEIITPTEKTLGIGYINKAVASVWLQPNKTKIASLSLNQPLIILELSFVSGSNWYKCRWESDGKINEGWILEENITFGPIPTSHP